MREKRSIHRSLIILPAAMAALLVSCNKPNPPASATAESPISIVVDPAEVKIEHVKPKIGERLDADPASHEIAQTDWIFSIKPELNISIKNEKQDKQGCRLTLEVTGVKLHLALPIKTTISDKAPQYVVDHENGHVQICTRVYAKAREYAQDAASKALGKQFEGFGSDHKLALSNAVEIAAQEIAAPYRTNTAAVAENVSSFYDRLCEKEDRKKLVEKTIDDAFAAVKVEEQRVQRQIQIDAQKRAIYTQKWAEERRKRALEKQKQAQKKSP